MILVTGGAGFIGSNMVAALCERGFDVVVCDRLESNDKWRNVARHALFDIVPPERVFDWLSTGPQIDAVIHMGAISATTATDADLVFDVNVTFSTQLWDWCARGSVPFIYASSAATYGNGSAGFDDDASLEALARLRPLNAYGWSKHFFDRRVARRVAAAEPAPPQWVGLKFFNVYGPNEYHKGPMQSVVAQKYPLVASGQPVTLFTSHHPDYPDGGQLRDFVFVDDCVDVMLLAARAPSSEWPFQPRLGHGSQLRRPGEGNRSCRGSAVAHRVHPDARGDPAELPVLHRGPDGQASRGGLLEALHLARGRRPPLRGGLPVAARSLPLTFGA